MTNSRNKLRIKLIITAAFVGIILIVRHGLLFYLENSKKAKMGDAEEQIANQILTLLINGGFWILISVLFFYAVVILVASITSFREN
jgi:fatty acid desaturase